MKKKLLLLCTITVFFIQSLPISSYAADRTDIIDYYFNTGLYYEALDELQWLEESGDRTVYSDEDIANMRYTLLYAAQSSEHIYQWLGRVKEYLNQGLYYEALDELNWLRASYFLCPSEERLYGEYRLDAELGIKKYQDSVAIQNVAAYSGFSAENLIILEEDQDWYLIAAIVSYPVGISYRLGYYDYLVDKYTGEVFFVGTENM